MTIIFHFLLNCRNFTISTTVMLYLRNIFLGNLLEMVERIANRHEKYRFCSRCSAVNRLKTFRPSIEWLAILGDSFSWLKTFQLSKYFKVFSQIVINLDIELLQGTHYRWQQQQRNYNSQWAVSFLSPKMRIVLNVWITKSNGKLCSV